VGLLKLTVMGGVTRNAYSGSLFRFSVKLRYCTITTTIMGYLYRFFFVGEGS